MDSIANAITKIRNASLSGLREVSLTKSKLIEQIVHILKAEDFISDFRVEESEIIVNLMYNRREPVIAGIQRVSKTGQRNYISHKNIRPVLRGRGVGIISTSKGIMSLDQAKKQGIGGEYICKVW